MTRHACVFCPQTFLNLPALVNHLVFTHRDVHQPRGCRGDDFWFHVYSSYGKQRIRCLCGQRYSANFLAAPAFAGWCTEESAELDSFIAHLKREGGLEAHLRRLRENALLDYIAGEDLDRLDGSGLTPERRREYDVARKAAEAIATRPKPNAQRQSLFPDPPGA